MRTLPGELSGVLSPVSVSFLLTASSIGLSATVVVFITSVIFSNPATKQQRIKHLFSRAHARRGSARRRRQRVRTVPVVALALAVPAGRPGGREVQ